MIDKLKHQRVQTIVRFGLVALAALVVSPVIFMVVKGMIGLIIAAVIGLVAVNVAPWLAMKVANWKVKAIVSEATANPIETLTNLLVEKRKAFVEFQKSVVLAATAAKTFRQKCAQFTEQYPHRAKEFEQQSDAIDLLVQRKQEALVQAQEMLRQGDLKLREMDAYFDMAKAAQAANAAAGMDIGDIYAQLKADTAVDSVFESMNKAFAEMEVAAALELTPPAQQPAQKLHIGSSMPNTLDFGIIDTKVKTIA